MCENVEMKNIVTLRGNCFKKRERTQNWNQEEKEHLLALCRNHLPIIENKRYDARHTEAKSRVWFLIHQRFSAQFGNERSVNRLKEKWRRMKAAARLEMQEYRTRARINPEVKKPSDIAFKICDLLDEVDFSEKEVPANTSSNEFIIRTEKCNTLIEAEEIQNNEFKTNKGSEIKQPLKYKLKSLNITNSEVINTNELDITSIKSEDLYDRNYLSRRPHVQDSSKILDIFNKNKPLMKRKLNCLQMQRKEHLMRMKIFKAHLKQINRTTHFLEICKKGMENSFLGHMNK